MLLCLAGRPVSAETAPTANEVKATYLVKFAHYVNWPASSFGTATASLALCIVGHDPFGPAIDAAVHDARVEDHPIVVRRIATIDRAAGCHIAFIAGGAAAQALPAIDGAPVLSVTDASETPARGVLTFDVRDGHVGFDIDDQAATRAGLTISSQLLSLAWSVRSHGARR